MTQPTKTEKNTIKKISKLTDDQLKETFWDFPSDSKKEDKTNGAK